MPTNPKGPYTARCAISLLCTHSVNPSSAASWPRSPPLSSHSCPQLVCAKHQWSISQVMTEIPCAEKLEAFILSTPKGTQNCP